MKTIRIVMAGIKYIFRTQNRATSVFIITAFLFAGNVNAYTYNGTTHTVTNSADSGAGTLRDILGNTDDGDIIEFDPGVTYITLTNGYLRINDSIYIKGPGPANLTIDGNANDRGFYMSQAGVTSIISGITITNCVTTGSSKGSGIYLGSPDDEQLTVSNCVIAACTSESGGSGIVFEGGKGIIIDTTINGCTTTGGGDGSALYNKADVDVYMRGCTLTDNISADDGGAIYSLKKLILENCTLSGNKSADIGGAVACVGTLAVTNRIINCVFSNNSSISGSSYSYGGALYVYRANIDISNCVFTANSASNSAAAIYLYDNLTHESRIWNSTISSNSTTGLYGSGLRINANNVWIYNSTFSDNTATAGGGYGGAIYENGSSFLFVDSSTFYNNHSYYGGALGLYDSAELRNCTISGNIADGRGGAVYMKSGSTETQKFYNCTIYDNTASSTANGGGIKNYNGAPLEIYSCIIVSNMPDSDIQGPITIMNNSLYNYRSNIPASETNNITGDPQLQPLADNGGPTLTHALKKGSIAIDAGSNPLALAYDQRGVGYQREVNQPDIGAYEFNAGTPKGAMLTIK